MNGAGLAEDDSGQGGGIRSLRAFPGSIIRLCVGQRLPVSGFWPRGFHVNSHDTVRASTRSEAAAFDVANANAPCGLDRVAGDAGALEDSSGGGGRGGFRGDGHTNIARTLRTYGNGNVREVNGGKREITRCFPAVSSPFPGGKRRLSELSEILDNPNENRIV